MAKGSKMLQTAMKSRFGPRRKCPILWTSRAESLSTRMNSSVVAFVFSFRHPIKSIGGETKNHFWDDDQHRPLLCQGFWRRDCGKPPANAQLLGPTRKRGLGTINTSPHHGELMGIDQFHGLIIYVYIRMYKYIYTSVCSIYTFEIIRDIDIIYI